MVNAYKVLGVQSRADIGQIKAAYYKLAREHHPDRGGDAKRFHEVAEAWHLLNHPARRKSHDETLILLGQDLPICELCGGRGVTWHQRGFTERYSKPCRACGGRQP
jgi:DnaJ-class molecular chaperone